MSLPSPITGPPERLLASGRVGTAETADPCLESISDQFSFMKNDPDSLALFMSKISKDESGCWIWIGYKNSAGYGRVFFWNRKGQPAHRWAYEYFKGEIPKGLVIDHLCRVHACCNPDHLEAVTNQVNIQRGVSPSMLIRKSGKCRNGHDMTPENVRFEYGMQKCKTCRNAYARIYNAKKRLLRKQAKPE